MKQLQTYVSILICITIFSCQNPNKPPVRESRKIDKEIFYGKVSEWNPDDTLSQVSLDCERAFGLPPIEKSPARTEIRIYYMTVFKARFFRELFYKDSVTIDLMNCGGDKRNDSLFMRLGNILTIKRKYNDRQVLSMMELLPNRKISPWNENNEPPTADGGETYFIQTRTGRIIKTILIDDPFKKAADDVEARLVSNFIKTIAKSYSFKFDDSWETIDSSALKN